MSSPQQPRSYTYMQQKILNLLLDGAEHTLDEIRMVIKDEYASLEAISMHMTRLNRSLPSHLMIIGRHYNGHGCRYRMMRTINWNE